MGSIKISEGAIYDKRLRSNCSSYGKKEMTPYPIYGVTIAEVEVDVLTGQHLIHRVDILEDAGISLNPEIDVGQVEGAFVMGIGYWTSEDLVYCPETAILTNQRTWVGLEDYLLDERKFFVTFVLVRICWNL